MNNETILIKKIFFEIARNSRQKEKIIYVAGYDYDSEVFPQLLSLYKDGYIYAKPEKDESESIVQLYIDKLTPRGEKYYSSLMT